MSILMGTNYASLVIDSPASVAQLDVRPTVLWVRPPPDPQHSFVEIGHEIISTVILSRCLKKDSCRFLAKECAQYCLTA